ncbi:hypothetical protein NliqN6_5580 [Naganishia liquefaciens]|uniref:Major facilitator superfamily (MFS) profile domain-containing protein n=1 Tax=Naganishia liquefaciens TaxID=104408 RepID=A0A8H3TYI5_9TREE|nr:hypothetical protein NliqN6_5580 [Naganishia liquefaciens]
MVQSPSLSQTPSQSVFHDMQPSAEAACDDVKRERRFVRKLDAVLVTWAFFAYLLKMIDGTNYKTAYVSGMKEELKLNNNELNFMDIYYRIGYAIFLMPCQIILTKVRPRWWLPSNEMAWGVMTALMAAAKDVRMMYALRFLIGVFEASSYPGIISILCNWYTPREVASRIVIFSASYPASAMFVSAMQASLTKTLDGSSGLSGWRWLFIFNAIMTFIVAGAGYLMVPDAPGSTSIFWMSEEDNRIALRRMQRAERLPSANYTWGLLRRIFKNPITYVFVLAYSTWSFSQDSNGWFVLFLKSVKNADGSKRFSVAEINAISIPAYALMLLAMLAFAYVHSRTGWHTTWVVVQETTLLIGVIILTIWPQAFATKMVAFFLLFCSNAVGPILIAWMSAHFRTPEERGIVIGLAVTFVFPMSAWMSIVFYPAKHAPQYPIGYKAPIAFASICILLTFVFRHLSLRDQRNKAFQVESVSSGEEYEEDREKEVMGETKSETDALPTLSHAVKRE